MPDCTHVLLGYFFESLSSPSIRETNEKFSFVSTISLGGTFLLRLLLRAPCCMWKPMDTTSTQCAISLRWRPCLSSLTRSETIFTKRQSVLDLKLKDSLPFLTLSLLYALALTEKSRRPIRKQRLCCVPRCMVMWRKNGSCRAWQCTITILRHSLRIVSALERSYAVQRAHPAAAMKCNGESNVVVEQN